MKIKEIVDVKCVEVKLQSTDKFEAIAELVGILNEAGKLKDYDIALKSVMDREAIRSTGVGQGFAIPHGKCAAVDTLVMAVGKTSEPIDYQSIDKEPVELIVLLVSPTDTTGPHIQALAQISRIMTTEESRKKIWRSKTSEELFKAIIGE
ncbi:MAG: PTS sugar transporter subunit IIA [Phycisphaerae bacterium]|nr:PTS sugar transporter subunit IIA [Phycisphaerae bacterium]